MLGKTNADMTFIEAFDLQWQIKDFFIPTQSDNQIWSASMV